LQLTELSLRWINDASSFNQVLDGVASVATTNKLGYFDSARAYNDIATVLWDSKRYALLAGEYFSNQGEAMNVLQIKGLLFINFRGNVYKTPILVHVPNSYPTQAPIVYVVPTQDLRVSPRCQYVQPDGLVVHHYLSSWHKASTIGGFLNQLAVSFGEAPPLFAPPPSGATPQTPSHHNSPYSPPVPKPIEPSPQELEQRRRLELEASVEAKLASAQAEQYKELATKLEKNNALKKLLTKKTAANEFKTTLLLKQTQQSRALIKALEEDCAMLQQLLHNSEKSNSNNTSNPPKSDLFDEEALSYDAYGKQLILEDATDSTIDDLLVQLDQLLDEGKISIDAYLKEVRTLARRQFMSRTLAKKVMNSM
jgi:ESCRT-I complex subunit TSG101